MNIIIDLLLNKWEVNVYNFILIIVNYLIKITQYISVIKKLNTVKLTNIYIEQIIYCYKEFKSIVLNWESIFISIYWSKFCY